MKAFIWFWIDLPFLMLKLTNFITWKSMAYILILLALCAGVYKLLKDDHLI